MNDFTVTVIDPDRAADWQTIFGRTTVAVQSPVPRRAELPGHPDTKIYMLDLDALTSEETDRLVAFLTRRFNIAESDIARDLREQGVPILADDCIVTVSYQQRWF